MTSVDERHSGAHAGAPRAGAVGAARTPLVTRRRRPGLVMVAVLVIAGGGLAGAVLYQNAGAKTPVVIAARDMSVGHRIERADLASVAIAGPVVAIAASNLGSLVGQTAAVGLVAGQILNRAMVTDRLALDGDHAMVGLSLKAGQLPGDGLEPGDRVMLVRLPTADAAAGVEATGRVIVGRAQVYAVRADETAAGATIVTLVVGVADAPMVAALGSAGQVGLIEVAQ